MARYVIKAKDAGEFQRVKALVSVGRVPVFLASERRHVLTTGALSPELERDVIAAGATVALEAGHEPETAYEEARAQSASTPKQALLERLRGQPARGIDWKREDPYEDRH